MKKYFWPLMQNAISFSQKLKLIFFILKTNKFTNGPKVEEFEKAWSKWLGCKYSLFVSSGSTANFLLISSIKEKHNLKDGDKVLVPACTWMTSVAPIFQNKLTPIFIDVSLENYCIEIEDLLKIKEVHPDIKLVFTTHLLGFYSEIDKIREIFPDALYAEDSCEAHGVKDDLSNKMNSKSLGSTFSFYFGHHMTTIEGGFVSTNDDNLYDLMKMKRSHGLAREATSNAFKEYQLKYPDIIPSFLFVTDGFNFRNTEIAAVLGLLQLKSLNKIIKIRNENFKNFYCLLKNYENFFYVPTCKETMSSFTFPIVCKNKFIYEKMISCFKKYGVEYRPLVAGNLLKQPFLKNYSFDYEKKIFNADVIHELGLYIGNNQFVGKKHLNLIKKILKEVELNVKN